MSAPASSIHVPAILAPSRLRPGRRLRAMLVGAVLVCAIALGAGALPVQVSGRVLDVEWRPVAGAKASLVIDGKAVAGATTNTGGWFLLRGGHTYQAYEVVASAPGFVTARLDPSTGTVLLHQMGSLSGQVLDDLGASVAGATISLRLQGSHDVVSAHTDAGGGFALARALVPGDFAVLVEAPNHDPFQGALKVQPDSSQTLSAVLVRQLGTIALATDPPGLRLLLDGQPMPECLATPCNAVVTAGKHVLSVGDDLYVPWQQEIDVQRQATVSVSQELQRKLGILIVSAATVTGGDLRVDGKSVPTGWRGQLPTGSHLITYRGPSVWPAIKPVQVVWDQETNVSLTSIPVATSSGAFEAQMNTYLAGAGGQYGVYLQELSSGQEMGSGQNTVMEAASVIKIPVALYTYQQSEAGRISLDDKVTLKSADFMGGTGILYGRARAGDQYAYRDLLALLIQRSDNTAWQALRRSLGSSAIDAYAASVGAPHCHQFSDNCTAREAGLMLAGLYRGKLLNAPDTQALLRLLETTVFNDRINYYLPARTIAHKVGMDGSVMNDAGIVYEPGDPFLISMFTLAGDPSTGIQAIRDVSRAADWYYTHT